MATDDAYARRPSWSLLLLFLALFLCSGMRGTQAAGPGDLCGLSGSEQSATGDGSCQINCLVYDPVCGANGVTYGCGCVEANCNGVRVVKLGEC